MPTNSAFQTKLIFILLVIIILILSTVKNDNIIGFLYYAHPPLPPYTSPNLHPPPQCRWVLVSRISKYLHHINCGVIAVTTREKISYFFTCVVIAYQLLTCHSPLAPLGKVDEWIAKPARFSIQGTLSELSRIVAAKTLKYPFCWQTVKFKLS